MSTLGSLFYIHLEAQSASSFADVLAGKRFSSSNFAPGASACMLLPESPMPLMPDVAKGTTVFPEKSYCSIKVSMIEGSLYHHTGKPTNTMLYCPILSTFDPIAGHHPGLSNC